MVVGRPFVSVQSTTALTPLVRTITQQGASTTIKSYRGEKPIDIATQVN